MNVPENLPQLHVGILILALVFFGQYNVLFCFLVEIVKYALFFNLVEHDSCIICVIYNALW